MTTINETPGCGPGARQNFDPTSESKPQSRFKLHFFAARASVQLATILNPDLPDGTALALGANLALLLRQNRIQPGQLIFQPGEGKEAT